MTNEVSRSEAEEILNPYYGRVVGFVDENGEFSQYYTEWPRSLVINVGSHDHVEMGHNVLVFALGPEIVDPESSESLGRFEVVRGEGSVTTLQPKMAIVTSNKTETVRFTKPRLGMTGVLSAGAEEVSTRSVRLPFKAPQIGDFVRFV